MDSKLLLRNWNLPQCVLEQYEKNGLESMFQWQADCLSIDGVLDGRNLVYAAPTSAGKTLVVEILLLKRVLETGKKALFILPFVSVSREKLFHLRNLFEKTGIRVDGYMGGHAPTNGFSSVDIAVCTIEKANGLINRLIEENTIDQIGMLVVDELHMVGDEGRGYILELLLTKIQFMSKSVKNTQNNNTNIQIVGMSATLPNLELLSDWLDAALYTTDFRPVPLQRCLKIGKTIYDDKLVKLREFLPGFSCKNDDDDITALCYETLEEGNSVLVFCPTKAWCEKLANNIAHHFYDLNTAHQKDDNDPHCVKLDLENLKDIYEQLNRSPVGVDAILNRTLPLGVAYHHAGLTTEERDIVEAGFRTGAIRVLIATSTLSSGVNLPARRVIIRTPTFNRKTLDVRTYLQMTGRAGRKGVDEHGESILICRQNEHSKGKTLLTAKPLPVKSCLIQAGNEELTTSMKRAILEIIVNGIASTYESVMAYTDCTLLSTQIKVEAPKEIKGPMTRRRSSFSSPGVKKERGFNKDVIETCIDWLVQHEFAHIQENGDNKDQQIVATQLGRAALLSSLPTADALTVLADLHQAMKSLALDTELHLIYLVTPIFCYNEWTGLDWYKYINVYNALSSSYKNAATRIGVTEQFLMRMASGAPMNNRRGKQLEKVQRLLGTHRRFYAALALHDLVQEVPLSDVCNKYSCNRGMLQQLQQSAASFAGMVTTFCQQLGWWSLEVLLKEFQTRLAFGVQRELMDLMQITLLNSQRARALYSAGLSTCQLVSQSKPSDIELVLRNSTHFQTERKAVNESEWEVEERRKQRTIHVTGHKGLTEFEAADIIVNEAKRICGLSQINKENDVSIDRAEEYDMKNNKVTSNLAEVDKNKITEHEASCAVIDDARNTNISLTDPEKLNDSLSDKEKNQCRNLIETTVDSENTVKANVKPIALNDSVETNNDEAKPSQAKSDYSSLTNTQLQLVLNDGSMSFSPESQTLPDIVKESIKYQEHTDNLIEDSDIFAQNSTTETSENVDSQRQIEEPEDDCEPEKWLDDSVSKLSCADSQISSGIINSFTCESPDQFANSSSDDSGNVDNGGLTLFLSQDSTQNDNVLDSSELDAPITLVFAESMSDHSTSDENENPLPVPVFTNSETDCSSLIGNDVKIRPEKNKCAKTSLTDSQLVAMLGDSFTQDVTTSSLPKKQSNCETPNPLKNAYIPELSPSTLQALEMSFSPCISAVNTPTEQQSKPFGRAHMYQEVSSCNTALKPSEVLSGKLFFKKQARQYNETTASQSTPKLSKDTIMTHPTNLDNQKHKGKEIVHSPYIISLAQVNSETLFKPGLGSKINTTSQSTPIVQDPIKNYKGKHDLKHTSKEKVHSPHISLGQVNLMKTSNTIIQTPIQNGNDIPSDNSLEDMFSCTTEFEETNINDTKSFKDLSINNLDKAFNISDSSYSDQNIEDIKKSEFAISDSKNIEKNVNAGHKRKSPDYAHSLVKSARTDIHISKTPKSYSREDYLDDAQIILSSQKEELGPKKKRKTKAKKSILPKSKVLNEIENTFSSNDDDIFCRKQISDSNEQTMVSSSQNLKSLDQVSQKVTASQSGLTIIDVCSHTELFEAFINEWKTKSYFSFSVATRSIKKQSIKSKIGLNSEAIVNDQESEILDSFNVVGLAICWGQQDAYYVSFEQEDRDLLLYKSEFSEMLSPSLDESLVSNRAVKYLNLSSNPFHSKNNVTVALDIKKQFKILRKIVETSNAFWQDPIIGAWMLKPSAKEKNLIGLVNQFLPQESHLLRGLNKCNNFGSISCTEKNDVHAPARIRACAEAVCSYRLMKKLKDELKSVGMWKMYCYVEMPHIRSLALMEINGIGFDAAASSIETTNLHEMSQELEKKAYKLARKKFNIASPLEVAKILYGDLGLPVPGDDASTTKPITTIKPTLWRKGSSRSGRVPQSWSTKKEVLERLKDKHPLPEVIMNWRQINFTLMKSMHPFQRVGLYCDELKMNRIHPHCVSNSVTGRVSIAEPNIQNVPKEFVVKLDKDNSRKVCIRNLFIPCGGRVFLAADYSQLEIRIFAHLSNDNKLIQILNTSTGDVFKMIAAQWKEIDLSSVTAEERQRAKQICYGMLYGIGAKALSQQLNIDEKSAQKFMESFLQSFPGIKSYIRTLVQRCRKNGYVETLLGRRRYLDSINDSNMSIRSRAERQAVNTMVQGSAADLIKKATVKMQSVMKKKWKTVIGQQNLLRKQSSSCLFVLHLHDELMFEVDKHILKEVACVVRTCMEEAVELKVNLPVKIFVGETWGKLKEYRA